MVTLTKKLCYSVFARKVSVFKTIFSRTGNPNLGRKCGAYNCSCGSLRLLLEEINKLAFSFNFNMMRKGGFGTAIKPHSLPQMIEYMKKKSLD